MTNDQMNYQFTEQQVTQLSIYAQMMIEWNEYFNLTAILEPEAIRALHFQDSLALSIAADLSKVKGLADIGTGAGLPGIPLKICFPHLFVLLVEVNGKKRSFLEQVIAKLQLTNIDIYPHDWRTFLRNTSYDVDLICARASLQPDELSRMFKPSSPYKDKQLFYWASKNWVPAPFMQPFILKTYSYRVADRQCQLVYMSRATL